MLNSPSHLHRVIVHVYHGFSCRDRTTISTSHVDETPIRVVDNQMKLEILNEVYRPDRQRESAALRSRPNCSNRSQYSISASLVASDGKVVMPYSTNLGQYAATSHTAELTAKRGSGFRNDQLHMYRGLFRLGRNIDASSSDQWNVCV